MSTGCPANRNPYARLLPLQDQLCRVARGWRELERERFDGRAQRLRSYPAGAHIPRAHLVVDGHTPSLDGAVDDDLPAGCAGDHVQGVRPRLHPHAGDLGGERYVDARGFVGAEPPRLVERDQPWRLRSEEHTAELQSPDHLVWRPLPEKKKYAAPGRRGRV